MYFCKNYNYYLVYHLVVMKTNIKTATKKNWALPGEPLSLDEFKKGIEDAEKGPFYTIDESKKMITQWRKQRNSK